jgi:Zn-dependent peptidase ImmA (M78 family)/DNA-binding XRE family transcriptional regulator
MALENKFRQAAAVNPAMVTLARELRGLPQRELASELELQQGSLSKIESGDIPIGPIALATLARKLNLPESFFSQTDTVFPFGSSTFYHRKQQSLTSTDLRKIQARINIHRFHVAKLVRATDLDRRCKFRRFDIQEHRCKIREVANLIRAAWRIPPGPIPDMIRTIEDAGGIVIRFDFGTARLFGVSEWIPPAPPLFFLNSNPEISADRDRFTLAHELAHILLHELPTLTMEEEADLFAGEFLMPEREIRVHLHPPLKLLRLVELKKHWKVSIQSLIENAFRLGVINERQRQYLWIQLSSKGYRLREPVELVREQPTLLREIVRAHIRELGYTTSDLSRMLHMNVDEFKNWYLPEDSGLMLVKS